MKRIWNGTQDEAGKLESQSGIGLEAQNELAYLTIAGEEFEKLYTN